MAGFEPTTSCSQNRRATGLRYTLKSVDVVSMVDIIGYCSGYCSGYYDSKDKRVMGIEPISAVWKADNLPLIYTRWGE